MIFPWIVVLGVSPPHKYDSTRAIALLCQSQWSLSETGLRTHGPVPLFANLAWRTPFKTPKKRKLFEQTIFLAQRFIFKVSRIVCNPIPHLEGIHVQHNGGRLPLTNVTRNPLQGRIGSTPIRLLLLHRAEEWGRWDQGSDFPEEKGKEKKDSLPFPPFWGHVPRGMTGEMRVQIVIFNYSLSHLRWSEVCHHCHLNLLIISSSAKESFSPFWSWVSHRSESKIIWEKRVK